MNSLKLRPHHALRAQFFEGKGYSEAFVAHMYGILSELDRGASVTFVDGCDAICAGCPNMQTIVNYLCDCCLGWVFFRKEQKAGRAALEGAAVFFKHGKTLLRNAGRIFGMSMLFLILVGGAFFGILFGIFSMIPSAFTKLTEELGEMAVRMEFELPAAFQDPKMVILIAAAIGALILWGIIHSAFVRPFILVGVLRNYMESGKNDIPTEQAVAEIGGRSSRLQRLLNGEM
jgi:hypothetical protein